MKSDILTDYYRPLLERNNFHPVSCPEKFSPAGQCWKIAPAVGEGFYWVYAKQDLFDIKIHDFYFNDDCCLDMAIPECISIQRYDSISGEELNPYRRLSAGDIQTIVGGKQRYRALIHKRIPIHSVGIEILPAYYDDFLRQQYPDLYFDLPSAFQSIDQAADFPAMSKLLFEIENYRGDGAAAALFLRGQGYGGDCSGCGRMEAAEPEAGTAALGGRRGKLAKRRQLYRRSLCLRYSAGAAGEYRLHERKQAEKLLQAAVWVQRYAAYSGQENEPGGASADQYRFYHGANRSDDRLHDLQPVCGAVQKEYGHSADRVSEAGKKGIGAPDVFEKNC